MVGFRHDDPDSALREQLRRGNGSGCGAGSPIKDPVGRAKDGTPFRYSEPRQVIDSGFVITGERPLLVSSLMHVLAIALAWLVLGSVGCSEPAASRPGNVLLITLDTLRADRVGAYGSARKTTPNLDRFFENGRIFLNGYATSSYTPPSVVSILTGRLPQDHGVRLFLELYDERVPLVCDLLPDTWQTAAFVSNAVLTNEALGVASCFDLYDDYVDEREGPIRKLYERSARRTTDAALTWLRKARDTDRRTLLWVHYIDPHGPYQAPPEADADFQHQGSQNFDVERMPLYARLGVNDALEVIDRYDEEIAYADREIGRLLAGWSELSAVDRDLVIFTSDHGESLTERAKAFDHGFHVWEEQIRVPIMLRGAGVVRARISEPASLVDVLPTILGFANVAPPGALTGVDLRSEALDPNRMVYAESRAWTAVVQARRKWVQRFAPRGPAVEETRYYDLEKDPHESQRTAWPADEAASKWLVALGARDPDRRPGSRAKPKGSFPREPKVAPGASEEQLEQLRGLGYID